MKTCHGYWPEPGVPCLRALRDGVCPKQGDPHHGYRRNAPPDDPRWDWVDTSTMSEPDQWIKGSCRHLTPYPVEVADPMDPDVRITVAKICPDCDTELWSWDREVLPEPNGFERWLYPPLVVDHPAGLEETIRLALKDQRTTILPATLDRPHPVYVPGGVIHVGTPSRPPCWVRVAEFHAKVWNWTKKTAIMIAPLYAIVLGVALMDALGGLISD